MNAQAELKEAWVKFEKVKTELQATSRIFNYFTTLNVDDLKTWTLEQWNIILNVFDTTFKSGIPDFSDLIKFLDQLEPIITQTSCEIYCKILVFVLEIVVNVLSELQNSQSTAQQNNTKITISSVIKILAVFKISSVKSLSDEQFTTLLKVINNLYTIVSLKPPFIDIITILEIWKSFSNFVTVYMKRAQAQAPHNIDKLRQVLEKPVAYLLQEVGNNIEFVKNVEALQRPIPQLDKYLRVTNFYLKILRGVLSGTKHKEFIAVIAFFENHKKSKLYSIKLYIAYLAIASVVESIYLVVCLIIKSFFNVVIRLISIPPHLIGTEIEKLLEKYVQKDFEVLLDFVYQHPEIFKQLLAFIERHPDSQKYILLDVYLCTIISSGDGDFISKNTSSFIQMFELCFKESKAFLNLKTCDDIIVQFSALVLLDETTNLLDYFRKNIFKDNFWIAAASTEVLILVQRYQHKYFDSILFEELQFWQNCNSSFAVFSNNILQTHIVRLFENCAQLSGSSLKTQLLQPCNIKHLSPKDYRNYLIVGVHKVNDINTELNHLLNELSTGNGTVECYYKSVLYMQLLASYHTTPSREIVENVAIAIRKFLNLGISERNIFSLFISMSLKLLAKFIDTAQSYDAEQLLNRFNMFRNIEIFPGSLNLLYSYTKSSSLQWKQQAASALKGNEIVPFSDLSCANVVDIIEFINNRKHSHTCSNKNSPEGPQTKRKCFEANW